LSLSGVHVNRTSLLILLAGLLVGFLGGYLAHETMRDLQPARLPAGGAPDTPHTAAMGGAAPLPGMSDIDRLREALERNPDDRMALVELANLNFDIGNWARAQELYERSLRLEPNDPDVLTDLGIALRSQGLVDRALERFREAQRLRPDHWQARFNEVVVLAFDRGDFAGAERALEDLRRLAPGSPDIERLEQEIERRREAG
jgi:cytochrome c-type biogenesis protein CcmH/NrfG